MIKMSEREQSLQKLFGGTAWIAGVDEVPSTLKHGSTGWIAGAADVPCTPHRRTVAVAEEKSLAQWIADGSCGSPVQANKGSLFRKKEARKFFSSRPGARKVSGAAQRRSKESFGTVKGS